MSREKVEKKLSGSIAGHHFGREELAKLGAGYLSLAKELLGETKLVATGRKVVTGEDLAVFLMMLRFFTQQHERRRLVARRQVAGDVDGVARGGGRGAGLVPSQVCDDAELSERQGA